MPNVKVVVFDFQWIHFSQVVFNFVFNINCIIKYCISNVEI